MRTTDTNTLLGLEVLTPRTRLQAGAGRVPGVGVHTAEHVRFNAHGGAAASDAIG